MSVFWTYTCLAVGVFFAVVSMRAVVSLLPDAKAEKCLADYLGTPVLLSLITIPANLTFVPAYGWFRWWYLLVILCPTAIWYVGLFLQCLGLSDKCRELLERFSSWRYQRQHDAEDSRQHRRIAALDNAVARRNVRPVIRALSDRSAWIRRHAVVLLGDLGDAAAVEPLIASLDDPNAEVRELAIASLGRLNDRRAIGPLIKALDAYKNYSRISEDYRGSEREIAAASALCQLGHKSGVMHLIAKLESPLKEIRIAAANVLLALFSGPLATTLDRSLWKCIRTTVNKAHVDDPHRHRDEPSSMQTCHYDTYSHTDYGIGLSFPAEPPVQTGQKKKDF